MKINYLLVLFGIICFSCSQTKYLGGNNKDIGYIIKEVFQHELFDIIYAQKNDSLFKIISPRDTIVTMSNSKPLAVGQKYQLDLIQIYPDYNNEKTKIGAIDSCIMSIEKKFHFRLYSATNLNGLFLLEISKDNTEVMNRMSIYDILGDAVQRNRKAFLTVMYLK